MEAGRELDAMIAEKVMGWRWGAPSPHHAILMEPREFAYHVTERPYMGWTEGVPATAERFLDGAEWVLPSLALSGVPAYSTDIAAAWLVVEKMHERIFAHSSAPAGEVPQPWPNANYLTLVSLGGAPDSGYAAAFTCVAMCDDDLEWFDNPERFGGAQGTTPAQAICLAALAALSENAHVV